MYLDQYTPEQARRHEVKPGITPVKCASLLIGMNFTGQAGWAQVNGRNAGFVCGFGFEMVI